MRHLKALLMLISLTFCLYAQDGGEKVTLKELTVVVEELIKKQNENSAKLDEIKKELLSNSKKLELLGQNGEENSQEIKYISAALKEIAHKLEINKEYKQAPNIAQPTSIPLSKESFKAVIVTENANIRKNSEIKKESIVFRLDSGMEITVSKGKSRGWYTIADKLYLHKTGLRKVELGVVALAPDIIMVEVESSFAQLKKEMLLSNNAIIGVLKKGVSLAVKEIDNEWYELMETLYVHESNINILN